MTRHRLQLFDRLLIGAVFAFLAVLIVTHWH